MNELMSRYVADATAAPPVLGRRQRVLVVDDQALNIQALHQALAAEHQVFMATSGAQALALCAANPPDLVLLDVVMPDIDGHEVCRRLKADDRTRDIPVIFVTAHNDPAAEAEGLELGAVDFISKPIHPKVVRARVRTQLTVKAHTDLLRHWAKIDGLTSVPNRRHFDEQFAAEWLRSQRDDAPLSLLLIDIDHFKAYNDRYGHQAGDDSLRRVAAAARRALRRPGDLLARYGGEEFVCLLPDTDLCGALEVAERIRAEVAGLQVEHAASSTAAVLTVSIGVAERHADATNDTAALLGWADRRLYQAKRDGRNRAASSDESAGNSAARVARAA